MPAEYIKANLLLENELIAAPTLLHAEPAHVFGKYVKHGDIDPIAARSKLDATLLLVDESVSDQELYSEAFREAMRLERSSCDMFYFILARRTGATLFTLDKKLIELCLNNGVDCLYKTTLAD